MVEQTEHVIVTDDARQLSRVPDDSVDFVVTSPPYPMIEMWDDVFTSMDGDIETYLENGEAERAFDAMHAQLDSVWSEIARVMVDGGIACINIGVATRNIGGSFQKFANNVPVSKAFRDAGFQELPSIYWQKPTNSGAKFMGSGCLPSNQYVTLEHAHILVFRNGMPREFPQNDENRYESAYFWEERNEWFSDHWSGIVGVNQSLSVVNEEHTHDVISDGGNGDMGDQGLRDRSGAFPVVIPYRLIQMFTVYGDTVLDPFVGTGTTTIAAMMSGRDSIGCEIDGDVIKRIHDRVKSVPKQCREMIQHRIENHQEFVQSQRDRGEDLQYEHDNYPFPVMTQQERSMRFYQADRVDHGCSDPSLITALNHSDEPTDAFTVQYSPYNGGVPTRLSQF